MATRRRVLTAAGAIAITAVSAPRIVRAQTRGQQPGADTPRILIATCHTPTAGTSTLGVDVAEAVRSRVQQENSIRQLYVLSRNDINNYLGSVGRPGVINDMTQNYWNTYTQAIINATPPTP